MAVNRRRANENWNPANEDGTITWDRVDTALLMDIRDELQRLNNLLHCGNFIDIPRKLDAIKRQTKQPKEKRKTA